MKNLRRVCAITLLSCIFAMSAYAGDISAGRSSAPGKTNMTTSETYGVVSRGVKQVVINLILTLL